MLKKELTLTQIKSNLLIAKFMGLEKLNKHYYLYPQINDDDPLLIHYKQLKYHICWDWIMPVVQKCYKIDNEEGFDNVVDAVSILDFDAIYQAVLEFIKEYNKEK